MTSYIQTTQYQRERINHQVLSWVLPVSIREEVNDSVERETESKGSKWSSLYSLSSNKESITDYKYKDNKSVPPLDPTTLKKSKSGSKNSLDMCTETLGCENGTMYTTDDYKRDTVLSDRIGFITHEEAEERRRERKEMVKRRMKRVKTSSMLPPALTTRTRENFVNIVKQRDNGRMVMYALRRQSTVTAERRDGRLKLHLLSSRSDEMKTNQDENKITTGEEEEGEEGDYLGVVGKEMNENESGEDELEARNYVFRRCKEEEKRDDWNALIRVASAI